MSRPAAARPEQVGLVKTAAGSARPPRHHGRTGDELVGADWFVRRERLGEAYELTRSAAGVVLSAARPCPPASSVIESAGRVAYLRLLAGHRRAARKAGVLGPGTGREPEPTSPWYYKSQFPYWLVVVNCSACRALLLGRRQTRADWRKRCGVVARRLDYVIYDHDTPLCPNCAFRAGVL